MLGYCMSCQQLGTIVQRRDVLGVMQYYPLQHDTPVLHAGCGGVVYDMADEFGVCACELCEQVVPVAEREPSKACDGHRRAIR